MHRTPPLSVQPHHSEQFWHRVDFDGDDGCWLWTAGTDGRYGIFQIRRSIKAHRFAYEDEVGPIPDGLVLDHLCAVKRCVNPAHLEPVTQAENLRRAGIPGPGLKRGAAQRAKTHCAQGHPYDNNNTLWTPQGYRRCRECNRLDLQRRRRADSPSA